jgi:tape measure domain-containing protein
VAYRADIEIGVRGTRQLEQLRSLITQTTTAFESLNRIAVSRGGLIQSLDNYTNQLNRASRAIDNVIMGSQAETKAIREYVTALGQANTARARQNYLIEQEIANRRRVQATMNAGFGQQGPAVPPSMRNAGFGQFGPALPPTTPKRAGPGIGKGISGVVSNAAIGGAFPLLFGQSGAAAAGGALGGIAGSFLGGAGGFAGSLIGTIIGEKVGQGSQIKELAADIGFSTEQTKLLADAFKQAGAEFDKFGLAVQNIRGLSLSINDQADAINLVSTLTEKYGGQIDKVTNAFTSALESGKVTQATLNQLTSQGIPIQQALADKYKVSRDAILKMAKDGKISTQELTDTLVDMGNKGVIAVNKPVSGFDQFNKGIKSLMSAIGDLASAIVRLLTPAFNWLAKQLAVIINAAAQGIQTVATLLSGGNAQTVVANARARKRLAAEGGPSTGTRYLTPAQQARLNVLQQEEQKKSIKPTKIGSIEAPGQAPTTGGSSSAANKAANEAKRLAEQTKKQLDDAYKLNELANARLEIQVSMTEEETLEAEFNRVSLEHRLKFRDLQKAALSQKERELIASAQLSTILADNNQYEKDKQKLIAKQTADLYTQIGLADVLGKKFQGTLAAGFMGTSGTGTFRTDMNLMPGLTGGKLGEEYGAIEQQLQRLLDPANQVITVAEGIGTAFSNSFKGLIDGSMTAQEALAGFFQSVASNFADMAAQMITQYIKMQIIGLAQKFLPITGGIFGAGGAPDYSGAFGGAGGLGSSQFSVNNNFGGYLASGGPATANTPYIVGEKGPELFMPGRSGTVIPNNAWGGGSTSVVVNVDASGNSNIQGDQAQAKQLGVVVSAAVQAELVKQQRPGGLLAVPDANGLLLRLSRLRQIQQHRWRGCHPCANHGLEHERRKTGVRNHPNQRHLLKKSWRPDLWLWHRQPDLHR